MAHQFFYCVYCYFSVDFIYIENPLKTVKLKKNCQPLCQRTEDRNIYSLFN